MLHYDTGVYKSVCISLSLLPDTLGFGLLHYLLPLYLWTILRVSALVFVFSYLVCNCHDYWKGKNENEYLQYKRCISLVSNISWFLTKIYLSTWIQFSCRYFIQFFATFCVGSYVVDPTFLMGRNDQNRDYVIRHGWW